MTPLAPAVYRDIVRRALEEDVGDGDITTEAIVPPDQRARGRFIANAGCVVAGLDVAIESFRQLDATVETQVHHGDGDACGAGQTIAEVTGLARALVTGERTALNFLQRLSGIATLTRQFVEAAAGRITVLDTRKTTPTLRTLEKYAVAAGGGSHHRRGLFDAVLIKDNHITLAGSVREAVSRVRAGPAGAGPVEVEVQTLAQVDEALAAGADVLLADNLPLEVVRETVRRAGQRMKGSAVVEVSGGVRLERVPALAATGASFVSVGALTHSAPAVDISFEIVPVVGLRDQ
jgi:nicotinate-nucleotide pyrophosphorylase (carboxylating)